MEQPDSYALPADVLSGLGARGHEEHAVLLRELLRLVERGLVLRVLHVALVRRDGHLGVGGLSGNRLETVV